MTSLNVAICQAAPIPLDFAGGIEKATRLSREAIDNGAQFVAAWPTMREEYAIASRHYAMEGRSSTPSTARILTGADR